MRALAATLLVLMTCFLGLWLFPACGDDDDDDDLSPSGDDDDSSSDDDGDDDAGDDDFSPDDDDDSSDDDTGDDDTGDDDTSTDDDDDNDDNNDDNDDNDDVTPDLDCEGDVCTDPQTGLMWQNGSDPSDTWAEAVDYCENLVWEDYDDWRMPTVDELRTLLRGCPATESDGTYGVVDECVESTCWTEDCGGCDYQGGPSVNDCYWPNEFGGNCWSIWSSLAAPDEPAYAWFVDFTDGSVLRMEMVDNNDAHCVR